MGMTGSLRQMEMTFFLAALEMIRCAQETATIL